jgi:hypothetical protein
MALRQFSGSERFRAFEMEIEDGIFREIDDRKHRLEEARQTREKKARRRRLKKQAALTS